MTNQNRLVVDAMWDCLEAANNVNDACGLAFNISGETLGFFSRCVKDGIVMDLPDLVAKCQPAMEAGEKAEAAIKAYDAAKKKLSDLIEANGGMPI